MAANRRSKIGFMDQHATATSWYSPLQHTLEGFGAVSLDEAQQVNLANRQDTKYLFDAAKLPAMLQTLAGKCSVLEINGLRHSRYETLYYDTPDWLLFRQHLRGQLSRYKVRSRRYLATNSTFFELKIKNNKQRTVKSRIEMSAMEDQPTDEAQQFLAEHLGDVPEGLRAVCRIKYRRLTLINPDLTERMTLDFDLGFDNGIRQYHYPNLVIAEVKQERSVQSVFTQLMQQFAIRRGKLSKYCWSVLTLNPELRRGNLKPMLIQLNKVLQHHD